MPMTADGNKGITHPLFTEWKPTWQMLLDVYEGSGGFLDPNRPYLIAHPREWLDHSVRETDTETGEVRMVPNPSPRIPSPKLRMRRKLARYENLADTILDAVMSSLFAEAPTRQVGEAGSDKKPTLIERWWKNTDGTGASIDRAMHQAWIPAAVFGHTILLMEKAAEPAATAADAQLPRLCRYTPLDLLDWLTDDEGKLTAVKLLEPAPRTTFDRQKANALRVRVVNETSWTLYDVKGDVIDSAEHGFGRLPIAILYGKRRALTPVVGKSVLGDPMLFIDAYNLVSEERELLRNQTFAILNVPLGAEGSVEAEQSRIGGQSGTANVMFSGQPAQFISPDGVNVEAYHKTQERLARMLYRLAAVPWDGDSRDAESADSRLIKRAELEATLSRYATELSDTDNELTELVYRCVHGDNWEAALKTDKPTTKYPDQFAPPDLTALVNDMAGAIGLDLGPTATKEIKKQTVRHLLPEAQASTLKTIDGEIDAQEILTAAEKQEKLLKGASERMAGRFGKPPKEAA